MARGVWVESKKLRRVGEKVFANYADKLHPDLGIDRVAFVFLKYSKTRWLGRCYVIHEPYKRFTDYDFIVVINYHVLKGEKTKKEFRRILAIVLLHELKHIDAAKGRLVRHNIEDFSSILKEFGINWSNKKKLPNILKRKG